MGYCARSRTAARKRRGERMRLHTARDTAVHLLNPVHGAADGTTYLLRLACTLRL